MFVEHHRGALARAPAGGAVGPDLVPRLHLFMGTRGREMRGVRHTSENKHTARFCPILGVAPQGFHADPTPTRQ